MPIFFDKYSSPPFILPFKSVLFKPSLILTHVFYYINDEVLTTVVVETDDLLFSVYFIERNKNLMMCQGQARYFIIMCSAENSSSQWEEEKPFVDVMPVLPAHTPIHLDWEKRWLKGHQYHHILENIDAYCESFGFKKFEPKTHPLEIYEQPVNGMIYFVKGKGVGQDFGFPRAQVKKRYRWKKMNFTTDLPKRRPFVTYVVASAMRAQLIEEGENAQFRMHAVIPYCQGRNASETNEYILCHVRAVDHKREIQDWGFRTCFIEQHVDFYRLFAFLHNNTNHALPQ